MTPTETQRLQLEQLIQELSDYSRDLLSSKQMAEWLDRAKFGEYESLYEHLCALGLEAGYEINLPKAWRPYEVGRYADARKLAADNLRNAPARIKSREKAIARIQGEIEDQRSAMANGVKRAWILYRELPDEQRAWLVGQEVVRELPPPVRENDNPPYEAVMGGEMSPKRRAQIEALKRLLETSDEEGGND